MRRTGSRSWRRRTRSRGRFPRCSSSPSASRRPRRILVDDSFDVCVVMQFADKAAMERYNQHPVHQKAANEAFLPLSKKILFYDFTSE